METVFHVNYCCLTNPSNPQMHTKKIKKAFHYFSVIHNWSGGSSEILPRPIMALSSDGGLAGTGICKKALFFRQSE